MRPDAIVFDLWFTLVSPWDHGRRARTIDAIPAVFGFEPEPFRAFWLGRTDEQERSPRLMREHIADYLGTLGRTLSEDEAAEFDALWVHHDRALASPRADVLTALSSLGADGCRLGVLSNAHEREIRTWSSSPLSPLIDVAYLSCHLGARKPEAAAYAAVLQGLSVPAFRAVFVGDGGSDELEGARAAGFGQTIFMRGVLAELGVEQEVLTSRADEADAVIDSIEELLALLV